MYPQYGLPGQVRPMAAAPNYLGSASQVYMGGTPQRYPNQVLAAPSAQAQSGSQNLTGSQLFVPQSTSQMPAAQPAAAPYVNQNAVTTPRGPSIGAAQNSVTQPSSSPLALTSMSMTPNTKLTPVTPVVSSREQALEQRIRDLESLVASKDETIKELRAVLANSGPEVGHKSQPNASGQKKVSGQVRSPGRAASAFRKLADAKPAQKYAAVDPDDPIDIRLEEFYNSTGSAIPFRRINKGFYRFGDSIVELDIINHKLMARTEDGWNRGKYGPIEKFLTFYENVEREKAGLMLE